MTKNATLERMDAAAGLPPYHVRHTHWINLGFRKFSADNWQIVNNRTGDTIGHRYESRAALLADLAAIGADMARDVETERLPDDCNKLEERDAYLEDRHR